MVGMGDNAGLGAIDVEGMIMSLLSFSDEPVKPDLEVTLTKLSIDLAVPLMMIINELITNTLKHHQDPHDISIVIRLSSNSGKLFLLYEDNGIWKEQDPEKKGSGMGSYIVNAMVRQFHGEHTRENTRHTIVLRLNEGDQ